MKQKASTAVLIRSQWRYYSNLCNVFYEMRTWYVLFSCVWTLCAPLRFTPMAIQANNPFNNTLFRHHRCNVKCFHWFRMYLIILIALWGEQSGISQRQTPVILLQTFPRMIREKASTRWTWIGGRFPGNWLSAFYFNCSYNCCRAASFSLFTPGFEEKSKDGPMLVLLVAGLTFHKMLRCDHAG